MWLLQIILLLSVIRHFSYLSTLLARKKTEALCKNKFSAFLNCFAYVWNDVEEQKGKYQLSKPITSNELKQVATTIMWCKLIRNPLSGSTSYTYVSIELSHAFWISLSIYRLLWVSEWTSRYKSLAIAFNFRIMLVVQIFSVHLLIE